MSIQQQFASLRRRFFNRPNAIQTRAGVAALPIASAHPHWVVGRDLCLYRQESFANVPRARRDAALQLKLPVWSPFANTGHHWVWHEAQAMIWLWDQDQIAPRLAASDFAGYADSLRQRPETVFYPRRSDGVCVQECSQGFELQSWREGVLDDSLWLPERPDDARLGSFLGRQGLASETGSVSWQPATPIADPWASPVTVRQWLAANEWPLAVCVLAILAAAALGFEARYWKALASAADIEAEFDARQQELAPVLAARNEMVLLRQRIGTMADILAQPSQARIMAVVDGALPSAAARFQRWRYQQGELRVLVEDPELDTVATIEALEEHFAQVEVGPSAQQGSIELVLGVEP